MESVISKELWKNPEFRSKGLNSLKLAFKKSQILESKISQKASCNTPEAKLQRSLNAKKICFKPENRFRLVNFRKSYVLNDESREKISISSKNRVCSFETRKKLSETSKDRKLSQESIAKGVKTRSLIPLKTHCKHGHSLHDAYLRSNNERVCKICNKIRKLNRTLICV